MELPKVVPFALRLWHGAHKGVETDISDDAEVSSDMNKNVWLIYYLSKRYYLYLIKFIYPKLCQHCKDDFSGK